MLSHDLAKHLLSLPNLEVYECGNGGPEVREVADDDNPNFEGLESYLEKHYILTMDRKSKILNRQQVYKEWYQNQPKKQVIVIDERKF